MFSNLELTSCLACTHCSDIVVELFTGLTEGREVSTGGFLLYVPVSTVFKEDRNRVTSSSVKTLGFDG